jgi:hypothetical protein
MEAGTWSLHMTVHMAVHIGRIVGVSSGKWP